MPEPVITISVIGTIASFVGGLFGGGSSKKQRQKRKARRAAKAEAARIARLPSLDPLVDVPIFIPPPKQGFVGPLPLPLPPGVIVPSVVQVIAAASKRALGVGAIVIIAAEVLKRSIEAKQLRKMGDILKKQDDEIAKINKRASARARVGITFPREFEILFPQARPAPRPSKRPQKVDLPVPRSVPLEIPQQPGTLPQTLPEPGIAVPRAPGTIPKPFPVTIPKRVPLPTSKPRLPAPVRFPLRIFFPISLPFPTPSPPRLTAPSVPRVSLPKLRPASQIDPQFAVPQPQAQPQPQTADRRCQEVKRRRRKKGKCREGFFRETPGSTKFTTWREKPCL